MKKKSTVKIMYVILLVVTICYYFPLAKNNIDYNKLKNAIDNNNLKEVERLLDNGANPDASNAKSYSGIFEQLSENKHNIFTILQYSAYCGNDEAIKILIRYGADPNNCPRSTMYSALSRAVMNDQINIKLSTIEILVNNSADVNCECNGRHLLYWLLNNYSPENSFGYDDAEIFKYLVEHGSDVYSDDYLLIACRFGKSDIIKYLISECGYKLDGNKEVIQYCEATKRLSQATLDYEMIDFFIKNGASIDENANDGARIKEYLNKIPK